MAGVSLGVFEALQDGIHTADNLADRLGLHARALEMLLRVLVVCGYLEQQGDGFTLSPIARRTMVSGASMQLIGYLRFNYVQWEFIAHLEELVRTGHGCAFHEAMTEPTRWRDYQLGMLELARLEAAVVAPLIPIRRGATRLLDVAGGHGYFGATVCRRHPPMRCIVLDLPQANAHARALAIDHGLSDVVSHRDGDVLTSDLGRHDVLLLFNILHHFPEHHVASLVKRAHEALTAKGTISIWEIEAPGKHSRVSTGDVASLLFRLSSTASVYHGDDYVRWLIEAGFKCVKVTRPRSTPGKVLVTAQRG